MDQQPTLCRTLTQYLNIKQRYISQQCMHDSIDYIVRNNGHCNGIDCAKCLFDEFTLCNIEQSYHYAKLLRQRICHESA